MTTSPPGSASAQKSDVMSDLEVRSPVPPTRSTTVLVEQVLARVRSGEPQDQAAKSAAASLRSPQAGSTPNNLPDIEVRKPPGPQAKPAPAPLKGPAASTPPHGPASAAAAQPGAPRPAGAGSGAPGAPQGGMAA